MSYEMNKGNMNDYKLPFTIIPLPDKSFTNNDILMDSGREIPILESTQQPDLTFHCIYCGDYFVHLDAMYDHMDNNHSDLHFDEENETKEELNDNEDYSWVLEPVCELIPLDEAKFSDHKITNIDNKLDIDSNSDSDTDDDDDDNDDTTSTSSTTTNSTSTSTSSTTTTKSKTNSNAEDTTIINRMDLQYIKSENNNFNEIINQDCESYNNSEYSNYIRPAYSIELKTGDPYESTSIILLNPTDSETKTTVNPVNVAIFKRGRGRKSAAETAALHQSSMQSTEPKCFQCAHCEASFLSAGDLSKHVRCHITNKPFQCSICEKTFTHIGSLNTHIRIHSGEKPYKCEMCSKAFTQSSSLMVHVKSHSIIKPHQCHLCDKGFVNSSSLVMHLKSHQGDERYTCSKCDSTFKLETQLKEHMRTHSLISLYQCSICRSAFANSSQLVQHMKCHMGEKPFTCSICDRSFTQSGSLNIHMRIHTGEKPFQCKQCSKSFTQASSLSVHMKIHLGEKTFSCHICGKSYNQAAYLNKHIQSHSFDQNKSLSRRETLLCIVCGALYSDPALLAQHVNEQHGVLLNNIANKEQPEYQQHLQQIQWLMQMQEHFNHLDSNKTKIQSTIFNERRENSKVLYDMEENDYDCMNNDNDDDKDINKNNDDIDTNDDLYDDDMDQSENDLVSNDNDFDNNQLDAENVSDTEKTNVSLSVQSIKQQKQTRIFGPESKFDDCN